MIRHIPHDGTIIPSKYKFIGEQISLRDKHAIEIFGQGKCLIFPIDRIICDVERFLENEPMESVGMGVCYEKNANLEPMRCVSTEEREEIISTYYIPHHKLLEDMVTEELNLYGKCLIIDCHTYRKEPWPYEDSSKTRPQIDIGFNKNSHTVNQITNMLSEDFSVYLNSPFSGALVPIRYMNDPRVESIMLEVRQDVDVYKAKKIINEKLSVLERNFYGNQL